jgi:hypothetical protein
MESNWISVKDRLPEERRYVLCYIKIDEFGIRDLQKTLSQRNGIWDDYNSCVTHWMPLPSPPTEQQD